MQQPDAKQKEDETWILAFRIDWMAAKMKIQFKVGKMMMKSFNIFCPYCIGKKLF